MPVHPPALRPPTLSIGFQGSPDVGGVSWSGIFGVGVVDGQPPYSYAWTVDRGSYGVRSPGTIWVHFPSGSGRVRCDVTDAAGRTANIDRSI